MKNLFAFNENNPLIHIKDVVKENGEKFTCCNCGNELIPRKGKIKAHHFPHKVETNCSYASYLHKLGKSTFVQNSISYRLSTRKNIVNLKRMTELN